MAIHVKATSRFAVPRAELAIPEPCITQWQRLEASPVALDLAPGLEARTADPLWMVGRQWQLGELKGEDAGTPVRAELAATTGPIRFPSTSARAGEPLAGPAGLVEPVVEAEALRSAQRALAAQAGLDFERALALRGVGKLAGTFRARFAFEAPPTFDAAADPAGARFLALTRGRAIDGAALATVFAAARDPDGTVTALPDGIDVPAVQRTPALAAATDWLRAWDGLLFEPDGASSWRDEHLEYTFELEAALPDGVTPLLADEYTGERLDWYAFDTGRTGALAAPGESREPVMVTLPAPIRSPGMPADRYWQFEDGSVNLADARGGPASIAMMLVLEYQLVSSNDWFQIPVELLYGHAYRIDRLQIVDTFGKVATVEPASAGPAGWAIFEPTRRHDEASPALFLLPSVTAEVLESPPIEEVSVFRDEMANIVWAHERRAPGLTLDPVEPLREQDGRLLSQRIAAEAGTIDAASLYRLQTPVPPAWFPFVAEIADARAGTVTLSRRDLRRVVLRDDGALAETGTKDDPPRGALLRGRDGRFDIDEREVPRSGLVLTRTVQHARTVDGRRVVWVGRRKRVGRGEGASDLRYDLVDPVRVDA